MLFCCSRPCTVSAAFPDPTALTTPLRLTCATDWSLEVHCNASGLTRRFPCAGTTTCSVSASPGARVTDAGPRIAKSACCTTIGAVAVSPAGPTTWIVPWPVLSATTVPFASTLATSSLSDFQVTATGAAGEPSSRSARG